ncbi:hypothetical protein [Nocardia paucivorans]|uniref:hypothetical protein n=1 Tax=Nocardia paucivorans TaxID=114259 RepID=UPI0002D4A521|nr:hypothetical protein [Nocardia paucivorans]
MVDSENVTESIGGYMRDLPGNTRIVFAHGMGHGSLFRLIRAAIGLSAESQERLAEFADELRMAEGLPEHSVFD